MLSVTRNKSMTSADVRLGDDRENIVLSNLELSKIGNRVLASH